MSDSRFIKLTEPEFELIMQLLIEADAREDADGQPAFEIHDDLQEQWWRNSDQWGWNNAEDSFIDAGMRAREMQKESAMSRIERPFADSDVRTGSLAADRRTERLMQGTATAFVANDPIDW